MRPTKEHIIPEADIHKILAIYDLDAPFSEQREYISYDGTHIDGLIKVILSVLLENGRRVVLKLLRDQADLEKERRIIEKQSAFSEFMRKNGIKTPRRYASFGSCCHEYIYHGVACLVTAEEHCGEEITQIDTDIAYKLGALMARMHTISLENGCEIGCGTLFSAAYWNDVDAFEQFCRLGADEDLDQHIVAQIRKYHDEKLEYLRTIWDGLPKAAVQGDISINNLVYGPDELTVFDYNNAGDEVLISDLVMEGLLTAYEMETASGVDRETLFPAMLEGYLSLRKLNKLEADAAWTIYTLYHALWFRRVVYSKGSLEKLLEKKDHAAADWLLRQMLADITQPDDGRFRA